jgi:hypothetical protein
MFLLNLCVECRSGTLSDLYLLKSGLLLDLLLGLVHGLRILRHQLHGNLRFSLSTPLKLSRKLLWVHHVTLNLGEVAAKALKCISEKFEHSIIFL